MFSMFVNNHLKVMFSMVGHRWLITLSFLASVYFLIAFEPYCCNIYTVATRNTCDYCMNYQMFLYLLTDIFKIV